MVKPKVIMADLNGLSGKGRLIPCIHYRDPATGHKTYHPASNVPALQVYDLELEDGSWKRVTRGLRCAWCGAERERMTIWLNRKLADLGKVVPGHMQPGLLCLCFMGCQHFPEPFEKAGSLEGWERIDPWEKKREQPRLRHRR